MIFQGLCDCMTGKQDASKKPAKFAGEVVLMKKNVLDLGDFNASFLDGVHELLGKGVSFQLVSSTVADPSTGKGKLGKESSLEEWVTTLTSVAAGESNFKVHFEWDESSLGIPGAVIVKNNHHSEFYLKTLTVKGLKGKPKVHFVCNSWIYPKYAYDRVFFSNDTYLPSKMPAALKPYREQELVNLRGDNVLRELKEPDRVYGYATYNDLGNPAKEDQVRPVLGGAEHPYPRRGRTSRPATKEDPNSESRESILHSLDIYVPRDERFGHLKMSDFLAYAVKAVGQALFPALRDVFDRDHEYDSFEDTFNLYDGGIPLPHSNFLENLRKSIPFEFIKEWVRTDGAHKFRLPLPDVLKVDKFAWRTDEEFGREMLAGVNPVLIRRLEEFPPKSKLDRSVYGDQTSTITADHIEKNLDGLSVTQALNTNRLFILDHHDHFIPYLPRINALKGNYIYATRTLLFLKDDGTLKPVAIELSEVQDDNFALGPKSKVYTPASEGVESNIWQLAKAYAAVNDSGFHQLISHWLNTHAVIEPFIIATYRQLSAAHPIHKLMSPHYRDTMNINALARQTLINAGGIFESTVFPQKYALTMSSDVYKSWKLTEQGLPDDLIKRGVAVEDPSSPNKIRLLIKDYPYAVDGMAVWSAIESWVNEYCSVYYPNDNTVKNDTELQAWWKEIREEGHGDLKDAPWWPKMHTFKELTKTLTTVIWVASALHAAVNFGQYPYAGYLPNRPTVSRRPMPERGTKEFEELENDPEKAFLKTITSQLQTLLGISLIEILSRHSTDEVYLGQRDTPEWTSDDKALTAFERFSERLIGIEEKIKQMNADEGLKNRAGPVKFPYTLLYPNTSDTSGTGGLVPKGIPNSVSI
ncbi:hypothetical protein LUZ60_006340 [Juncus effusus]|nr:hypothetical protein LUZ60_006340 [Juncus effusus]